jgi:hypothetical protein
VINHIERRSVVVRDERALYWERLIRRHLDFVGIVVHQELGPGDVVLVLLRGGVLVRVNRHRVRQRAGAGKINGSHGERV